MKVYTERLTKERRPQLAGPGRPEALGGFVFERQQHVWQQHGLCLPERDVAAPGRLSCSPGWRQVPRERGADGRLVEAEQSFPLSGGLPLHPSPPAQQLGDG